MLSRIEYFAMMPKAEKIFIKAAEEMPYSKSERSPNWFANTNKIYDAYHEYNDRITIFVNGERYSYFPAEIFGIFVDGKWHTEPSYIPKTFTDAHKGHWVKQGSNNKWVDIYLPEAFNKHRPCGYSIDNPNVCATEFHFSKDAPRKLEFKDIRPGMWVKIQKKGNDLWKDAALKMVGRWFEVVKKEPRVIYVKDCPFTWLDEDIAEISETKPFGRDTLTVSGWEPNIQLFEKEKGETMKITEESLKTLQEFDPANLAKAKEAAEKEIALAQESKAYAAYVAIQNELDQLNIDLKKMTERKDFLEKAKAAFDKK